MKLSFIVAIYNVERFLPSCLDSLMAQPGEELEFLLINDGSKDRSGEICEEYARRDSRFRAVHQPNGGVSAARNTGLGLAQGEWICFVDGDDMVYENAAQKLLCAAENETADVVIFDYVKQGETEQTPVYAPQFSEFSLSGESGIRAYREAIVSLSASRDARFGKAPVTVPWGKMIRRSFLEKNQLRFVINIRKSQDAVFALSCSRYVSAVHFIPECVYIYRVNSGSVTKRFQAEMIQTQRAYLSAMKDLIDGEPEDPKMLEGYTERCAWAVENVLLQMIFHGDCPWDHRERIRRLQELLEEPWAKLPVEAYFQRGAGKKIMREFAVLSRNSSLAWMERYFYLKYYIPRKLLGYSGMEKAKRLLGKAGRL